MSEQEKPREWHLYFIEGYLEDIIPIGRTLPEIGEGDEELCHVIEKSAYDALQAKLEAAEARCAELEKQIKENELLGCSPYCPSCNSCGEDGCCPAEFCKYPGIKAETVKELKEFAEKDAAEIQSLREQLAAKDAEIEKLEMALATQGVDFGHEIEKLKKRIIIDEDDFKSENDNLRADWLAMKASLEFYRDEAYELRAGTDIIAAEDGLVKYASGDIAGETLASLKYQEEG